VCLLACRRIQAQHDHLEKEYRQHAIGVLRCSKNRGSGKVSALEVFPQINLFVVFVLVVSVAAAAFVATDSKLLSGFPFVGHGNFYNNLESSCIIEIAVWIELRL
jgi:hypothetical protein